MNWYFNWIFHVSGVHFFPPSWWLHPWPERKSPGLDPSAQHDYCCPVDIVIESIIKSKCTTMTMTLGFRLQLQLGFFDSNSESVCVSVWTQNPLPRPYVCPWIPMSVFVSLSVSSCHHFSISAQGTATSPSPALESRTPISNSTGHGV